MNIFEKQAEFGRTFFEINQNALQQLAQIQQDNIKNYFALNSDFSKKLPEAKDITSFTGLQREYGETLWNGIKETTATQAELLKTAAEETGAAFRKVYADQTEG